MGKDILHFYDTYHDRVQYFHIKDTTYSSSYIAPSDHWSVLGASMQKYLGGQCTRDDLAADIDNYWTSQN